MRKRFIWKITIMILSIICLWIYFVSKFSSVYPPIKKYELQISEKDFRAYIDSKKKDSTELIISVTDVTGTKESGYNYYVDCKIKNIGFDNLFNFKYYKNKKKNKLSIDLIGAFNYGENIGGYKIENKGVSKLKKIFEHRFIDKIKVE